MHDWTALADRLQSIIEQLDDKQHVYWLQNLITARNAILRGDERGLRRLLGLYGEGYSLSAIRVASMQAEFDERVHGAQQLACQLLEQESPGDTR
ncbi:MAG: hypothetical protein AB8F65_00400 [Woeseiaceae bacterium]